MFLIRLNSMISFFFIQRKKGGPLRIHVCLVCFLFYNWRSKISNWSDDWFIQVISNKTKITWLKIEVFFHYGPQQFALKRKQHEV